jgi:hypothetical protein
MAETETEPSWRREIAAMQGICEALEPLDAATRQRVLAAVLCMMDDGVASAALRAFKESPRLVAAKR